MQAILLRHETMFQKQDAVLQRTSRETEGSAKEIRSQKLLQVNLQEKTGSNEKLNDEIETLVSKLDLEKKRKHLLFQQVHAPQGIVRVMCRIRPDTSGPLLEYTTETGYFYDHATKLAILEEGLRYEFDRVYLPEEANGNIFNGISHLIQSALDGKKVCIFCYGQSGTGKTYTMSNIDEVEHREEGVYYKNDGILPRASIMIFNEKKRLRDLDIELIISGCCSEIYGKKLQPLKAGRKRIRRETRRVDDLEFYELDTADDFSALIDIGMKNRHFGATALNNSSSRSHFIISLKLVKELKNESGLKYEGRLNLIDLAGFERTEQAQTAGTAFKEGNDINLSLMELRNVLTSLAKNEPPTYRNNTLTTALQPFLGKDYTTLMLIMISPLKENWQATKQTLEFAKIARVTKNHHRENRQTNVPASADGKRGSRK
ncbi:P-loop containing nucleoside triphosphate hydrolase protein [Daldinia caldariorum]|uniref:P-loop containing nucleoside triphosphate hydrolase protein n=1 Tax=Daldinia caldariorum TaxID=326644 RepID=UPI002008E6B6|nr:P-loop containing nucleoside triphosphate hydrolase protein [Daldinia caldariorum]KAI1470512.1 P-loop containing nucleoside triphosphate hydrolase protein [Daldinia caldariorum]